MRPRLMTISLRLLGPAVLLLGPLGHALWADSLVVNNVPYLNVRVTTVRDGEIFFVVGGTNIEIHKPLAQVSRITLNDEPAFTAAEEAYAAGDWNKATENYERALRVTAKPWLREWASLRLLESASQAGRFDSAIKAYIAQAEKNPAAVRSIKLKMPKADSAYLTDAVALVDAAIGKARQDAVKEVLLDLLVQLHQARNDPQSANQVMQRRLEMKAADPTTPEGARAAAQLRRQAVQVALSGRQWAKVVQLVKAELPAVTDPLAQAELLFAYAEAQAGLAGDSKNPQVWKDVALAYMRVVAQGPAQAPQVPAALLRTAALHAEHLAEPNTARRIYEQIINDYKGQPPAQEAQRLRERLEGR